MKKQCEMVTTHPDGTEVACGKEATWHTSDDVYVCTGCARGLVGEEVPKSLALVDRTDLVTMKKECASDMATYESRLRSVRWEHAPSDVQEIIYSTLAALCRYAPGRCFCGCHVTTVAGTERPE